MSEKMTSISLPGQCEFRGLMDYGEVDASEMIKLVRSYSADLRRRADAIDEADDADFQIDLVRGKIIHHHIRELQKSARDQTLILPNPHVSSSQGS